MMSLPKPLPEFINGFPLVQDLGFKKLSGKSRRLALVKCKVCPNEFIATVESLNKKSRKACGCLHNVCTLPPKRLIRIRNNMMQRCYNSKHGSYKNYAGRGITVCEEWINYPFKFYQWALRHGYDAKLSIDRIDNDKGYFPENCKWSTAKEQANNTRRNKNLSKNS